MADHDSLILSRLPRCSEWVAGIVSSPTYVVGDGDPYRPSAVLWVETGSGLIVGCDLLHPSEALGRAAGLFLETAREPLEGKARVPERVRVAEPELYDALQGRIGGVELVLAPTPELTPVAESFVAHMGLADEDDEDVELSYVGGDITADDVAHMFRAAARLYRLQPWRPFPPDGYVSVRCEQLGIEDGALCVVGQMGESFGFVLFRSVEDAVDFVVAADQVEAGRKGRFPQHVMFTYDERAALPPAMAGEIRTHGWEVAGPRAYPTFAMVDPDMTACVLTRPELLGVTAIVDALAELIENEPELAQAWQDDVQFERATEVSTAQGPIAVTIEAPLWLPEDAAPGITVEVSPDIDSVLDEDGDVDEDTYEAYVAALLSRFEASPDASEGRLAWAELIIRQAVDFHGATIAALTPDVLEAVLFKAIPRTATVESAAAEQIIDALRALLEFAARDLNLASASACLAWLPGDAAKRLARGLDDASKFSPEKSILMAGARAGYDVTTPEGIAEWLDVASAELVDQQQPAHAGGRRASGSTQRAAANKQRRKAARQARKKSRRH
jgi:hypothetical protein